MSASTVDYTYTAADAYQPAQAGVEDPLGRWYYPYLPSDDLKEAVNLAIVLQRPLLLEGEPGCGKTRLAGAIAYELTQKHLQGQLDQAGEPRWWDYRIWNVKSTSRAREGLYFYDAIARLRDAQLMGTDPQRLESFLGRDETEKLRKRLGDRQNYREFGALGAAIRNTDSRSVVLIDEIDKADSDFPNDLLLELDTLGFEVPETGEVIPPPAQKPILIITSNREKPLPDPFLRRCLYFYVDFPTEVDLLKIINRRFAPTDRQSELITTAIKQFYDMRKLLENRPGSRPPGTSEILEFLTALLRPNQQIDQAMQDLERLANRLPLLGILLKTRPDQELYRAQFREAGDE
jgi:MoxR-like ATPase